MTSTALSSTTRSVLLVIGLLAGFAATLFSIFSTDFPVDMVVYREGVRAFVEGRSVYTEPVDIGDLKLPFIYPPFGAMAMIPLAGEWLGHDAAGNIMILLSNVLIALCLWFGLKALFIQLGQQRTNRELAALTALAWGLACWFEPVQLNNEFGQVNTVIMALVFLDLVPRKRWLPQGTLIGLAAAIKITPLAMLLIFLMQKRWKPIVVAGLSGLLATAAAALYRPAAAWEFFAGKLLDMSSGEDFGVQTAYQSNSSISGAIERAYGTEEAMNAHTGLTNIIWLILAVVVVLAGAGIMSALLKREWYVEAVVVNSLIMLLISPVSWSHHWVWLALALPLLFVRGLDLYHHQPHRLIGTWLGLLGLWALLVLTVPPKWYFGDGIDVWGLPFYAKFLVSDFVWLALAALILLAGIVHNTHPGLKETAEPVSGH